MNNTDLHQPQQLRRDKLRFQEPPTDYTYYNPSMTKPSIYCHNANTQMAWNELPLGSTNPPVWQEMQKPQSLALSLSPNPLPEKSGNVFDSRSGSGSGIGPLGPFTGYAAVLRGSRFMKPGQQLLDEFCRVAMGSRLSNGAVAGGDGWLGGLFEDGAGVSCMPRPEFQHKKESLLYLQEEVCKRYKQYHQQVQLVVSSFESVPGLCAATPYISVALKSVMKHFRNLKNAIAHQLSRASKAVSDEYFTTSPASSKDDETIVKLKYIGQNIQNERTAGNSFNFMESSQPAWRPQRGLPERAVAVLRAWLFDHFLHPYPTDTDKHILAAQTGLSRNQVSNWFINARVRLWKPMVEEIHTLEVKETSGMNLNWSNRNDMNPPSGGRGQPSSDHIYRLQSNKTIDCALPEPRIDEESHQSVEQWHQVKRMRMDDRKRLRMEHCRIPACMDGSLMSVAGYPSGMDISGLAPVSLTLGLRHNEEAQQQQQQMVDFGGQMVHDFVG